MCCFFVIHGGQETWTCTRFHLWPHKLQLPSANPLIPFNHLLFTQEGGCAKSCSPFPLTTTQNRYWSAQLARPGFGSPQLSHVGCLLACCKPSQPGEDRVRFLQSMMKVTPMGTKTLYHSRNSLCPCHLGMFSGSHPGSPSREGTGGHLGGEWWGWGWGEPWNGRVFIGWCPTAVAKALDKRP